MPNAVNLTSEIEKQLPAELVEFMQMSGLLASSREESLYLVGGVVRDLLLGQANVDLDLVVEGNAIDLAYRLGTTKQAKITTHPHFDTAKLQWNNWSVDLATARSETYAKPGALPSVKAGTIENDLFRRDFTINAMAVCLTPGHYGELIDLHGGKNDIGHKLVRVLHGKSFIDDATRIWRSLRYEQRLDFQLEQNTLGLLKRDISMLDTISGDRIRHELELILNERYPEKVLRRAGELGVLAKLHPALKAESWLTEKFKEARQLGSTTTTPAGLYLALLTYNLSNDDIEHLISYLRFPKALAKIIRDTEGIKSNLQSLADPELAPSQIYRLLYGSSSIAVQANLLASDSVVTHRHLQLFIDKLRYVKPALTGNTLKNIGIAAGPQIKEILQLLHEARLDGRANNKQDEEEIVKEWLQTRQTK